MTCEEARPLIHGYADGELDLASSLEIERHLAECAGCNSVYREIRALRSALHSGLANFDAPAALRDAVRDRIDDARRAEGVRRRAAFTGRSLAISRRARTAVAIAAAAAVLAVVITAGLRRSGLSADDLIANEIVAGHVRSLMANHLADVISSNQHTVKPWFDGKIDFAPAVADFAAQGFPLAGGRLDYADNRPVAALVYHRRQHIINLFTWPAGDNADSGLRLEKRQGYNLVHWTRGGMEYWAVSNLNADELMKFAGLVRDASAAPAPSG